MHFRKQIAAFCCLVGVLLGAAWLPGPVSAAQEGLQAGYGKRPITPQCPTPMSGYGNTITRICETVDGLPVRIDDNGDGLVNEQDGLFATCILLEDAAGERLVLLSYDMIGVNNGLLTKLQNRLSRAPYNIPAQSVYLCASHSHSAPDMGWYFSYVTMGSDLTAAYDGDQFNAAYAQLAADGHPEQQAVVRQMRDYTYDVLLPGLMGAVDEALADLSPASMSTGVLRVPNMNHIRHAYNKADSEDDGDVYGVNTRGGGTLVKQYGDVNENMYLLRFDRQGKSPIVGVDWRAHATNSSTSGTNYGNDNRYRISSDFIGGFRYTLEQAGYLPSFFQGTAGNVTCGSVLYSGPGYSGNPTDMDSIRSWTWNGTTRPSIISPLYGAKLAGFAIQGLENNVEPASPEGGIQSERRYIYEDLDTRENYRMVGGTDENGLHAVPGMLYETVTDTKGSQMNVLDYLQTYYAYVTGWSTSPEKNQINALLDRYNLNSVYHLERVVSKFRLSMQAMTDEQGQPVTDDQGRQLYEPKSGVRGGFYVYAFSVGADFGCVTAPFEIFDSPYDYRDEYYRTTFVLGYTNGYLGYLPTESTYRFAGNRGAYEANNTPYAYGAAEDVARIQKGMLGGLDRSGLPEVCPACGTAVIWKPLSIAAEMTGGHYYLTDDAQGALIQMNVRAGVKACIHLNGRQLLNTGTVTSRCFAVYNGGELNLFDGTLQSQGAAITLNPDTGAPLSSPYQNAGVFLSNPGSTVNLYDVTVRYRVAEGQWSQYGGAIGANGTVSMHGGRVEMIDPDVIGAPTQGGGLINVGSQGVFHATDTVITGGKVCAGGLGGQIGGAAGARLILDGKTRVDGGIYVPAGMNVTLAGAARIPATEDGGLTLASGAGPVNAEGLTEGAEIWITPTVVPRQAARVADSAQAAYFQVDGAGRIACDAAGLVTVEEPFRKGDLNGDGKVNGKDVVQMQRYVAGGYQVALDMDLADLNKDGKINGKDVVLLQRVVVGGYGVSLG